MNRVCLLIAIGVFLQIFCSPLVFSQDLPLSSLFQTRAAQYHLGDKDQILMNVNVWGFVVRPGQYVVPRNTDLISLISFAGGPREGARLKNVQIIRAGELFNVTYGDNGTNGQNGQNGKNGHQKTKVPILSVNVQDYLKIGNIDEIPILKAGDTVIIPQTFGNKFKNALGVSSFVGIIAATASIVLIVERW